MKIFSYINDNVIIITPNSYKNKILEYLTKNKLFHQIKFYSMKEFIDEYLYTYKDDVLYYVSSKYNLNYDVASIILKNLYYIDDKEYNNKKLNNLNNIKNDLLNNNYIIDNNTLKKYLNNKKIIVYNYFNFDSYYFNILKKLNAEFINDDYSIKEIIDIYEFNTIEEEVVFLATTITNLINDNVDINKIKINKLSNEYKSVVNRIFSLFNIPYELNNSNKIIAYDITSYFLALLNTTDNINDCLEIIRESYDLTNDINLTIFNKIVNITNKYKNIDLNNVRELIKYEIKKEAINISRYSNVINEIEIDNYSYSDDEYVFILGFNQDIIPTIYKDDDYLSDIEKEILNIDTSKIKNIYTSNNLFIYLNKIKNLYVSYKLSSPSNKYNKSSFIDYLNKKMIVNIKKFSYDYSNFNYNNYILSNMLDNLIKYNEIDPNLNKLYFKNNYLTYNNKFKGINKDSLYNYIKNKINLSYSSIDIFYKCRFRYYLNNILNLSIDKEDTNSIIIGKLVHQVLCRVYKDSVSDYETIIEDELNKFYQGKELTFKEKFYVIKYKNEILKLIEIINNQKNNSDFKNGFYEKLFEVKCDSKLDITLKGYIDKVLTLNVSDKTYAVVVDYKTGTINNNFNLVIHGLNMQLLIYLYLLKKSINNVSFAGLYWQNVIKEVPNYEINKSINDILKSNYKLDGYTTKNIEILNHIDNNYMNDTYLKSIRIKSDGDFYSTSKVLSESEITNLLNITDKKIKEVIKSIEEADFNINPKRIGIEAINEISGCKYCEYYDICFKRNSDIVNLKEYKNLEFLGGDVSDIN